MAWCYTGDKPLSESMMAKFTDACVTQFQWVIELNGFCLKELGVESGWVWQPINFFVFGRFAFSGNNILWDSLMCPLGMKIYIDGLVQFMFFSIVLSCSVSIYICLL